jgi:hypothetical protein
MILTRQKLCQLTKTDNFSVLSISEIAKKNPDFTRDSSLYTILLFILVEELFQ